MSLLLSIAKFSNIQSMEHFFQDEKSKGIKKEHNFLITTLVN